MATLWNRRSVLSCRALLLTASILLVPTEVTAQSSGHFQHAIVATNDGQVHEVFFNSSAGTHITQPALATLPGIVSIAGYVTPNDGLQHVIVATNDGQVHEVFFSSSAGIHVTQPALAKLPGIVSIAGYVN